jgi:hypothetical protein
VPEPNTNDAQPVQRLRWNGFYTQESPYSTVMSLNK